MLRLKQETRMCCCDRNLTRSLNQIFANGYFHPQANQQDMSFQRAHFWRTQSTLSN